MRLGIRRHSEAVRGTLVFQLVKLRAVQVVRWDQALFSLQRNRFVTRRFFT